MAFKKLCLYWCRSKNRQSNTDFLPIQFSRNGARETVQSVLGNDCLMKQIKYFDSNAINNVFSSRIICIKYAYYFHFNTMSTVRVPVCLTLRNHFFGVFLFSFLIPVLDSSENCYVISLFLSLSKKIGWEFPAIIWCGASNVKTMSSCLRDKQLTRLSKKKLWKNSLHLMLKQLQLQFDVKLCEYNIDIITLMSIKSTD